MEITEMKPLEIILALALDELGDIQFVDNTAKEGAIQRNAVRKILNNLILRVDSEINTQTSAIEAELLKVQKERDEANALLREAEAKVFSLHLLYSGYAPCAGDGCNYVKFIDRISAHLNKQEKE